MPGFKKNRGSEMKEKKQSPERNTGLIFTCVFLYIYPTFYSTSCNFHFLYIPLPMFFCLNQNSILWFLLFICAPPFLFLHPVCIRFSLSSTPYVCSILYSTLYISHIVYLPLRMQSTSWASHSICDPLHMCPHSVRVSPISAPFHRCTTPYVNYFLCIFCESHSICVPLPVCGPLCMSYSVYVPLIRLSLCVYFP